MTIHACPTASAATAPFRKGSSMARALCFLAASVIAGIGSGCINAPAPSWKRVEPETGGFSCEMPGDPKVSSQQVNTVVGPIKVVQYTVTLRNREYVISSTTLPPNAPAATTAQRLDGARDGAVRAINGTLLGEKKIKLGSYDGREILIQKSAGVYVHARVFLVERQIIQAVAASTSKQQDDDIIRLFNSMQLLEK
jgi:hypothetical protein